MIPEQLEFRLASYADGTLPSAELAAVEAEVAADAEAQAALAEYQDVESAIRQAASVPLPPVRWDRFAVHLSSAVANVIPDGIGHLRADGVSSRQPATLDGGADDERTEFAIACYADGTLPAEDRPEVERWLATDDRARALLDEYENLDATLMASAYRVPFPVKDWDGLAQGLADAVRIGADAALPEEFERQIAEYAQSRATFEGENAIEARLASDPAARLALSDYRNLDAALRSLPRIAPVPSIDWGKFAGRIGAAVDAVGRDTAAGLVDAGLRTSKADRSTNGDREERSAEAPYRIWSWLRSPARMALAASVLIAAALGVRLSRHTAGPIAPPVESASYAEVSPLKPEEAAGTAVADVQIGPPKQLAQGDQNDDSDDGVVSSPPRAFVASGLTISRDTDDVLPAMPF